MPTAAELKRLANRSEEGGRQPIESFSLSELPPEIVRAFPSLVEWRKENNRRLQEFVKKMNVVIPVTTV